MLTITSLQLRQLLIIPPTQDIVLERFSDSAGAYIILDSNNPSIYKQLYRAAKAKLKLRIKVSIVDSSAPKPHTIDPEFLCTDRLSSNCYVPPTTPILAKTEFDGPLSAPANLGAPVGSAEVPALSSRLAQAQAQAEHSGRLFASRYRQELPPTTHLSSAACCMNPAAMSVKLASMGSAKDAPVATGAEDESSSPRVFSPRDHFYAELGNMSRDCPSSFLRTADQVISMPGSSFTICCNHCDVAIPNVHWHCGRCDNGDFDLCTDCVNKGILCDSTDHWLIKRFVQNGKVTNSTTERIEPKKAPAVETVVAKEAPAAQATVCESEILHEAHEESRTCNSCISGMVKNLHLECCAKPSQCSRRKTSLPAPSAITTTSARFVSLARNTVIIQITLLRPSASSPSLVRSPPTSVNQAGMYATGQPVMDATRSVISSWSCSSLGQRN